MMRFCAAVITASVIFIFAMAGIASATTFDVSGVFGPDPGGNPVLTGTIDIDTATGTVNAADLFAENLAIDGVFDSGNFLLSQTGPNSFFKTVDKFQFNPTTQTYNLLFCNFFCNNPSLDIVFSFDAPGAPTEGALISAGYFIDEAGGGCGGPLSCQDLVNLTGGQLSPSLATPIPPAVLLLASGLGVLGLLLGGNQVGWRMCPQPRRYSMSGGRIL